MLDIKGRLVSLGLQPEEISQHTGISQERILAILAGEDFTMKELVALTEGLGLTAADFIRKEERQKKAEFLFRRNAKGLDGGAERAVENLSSILSDSFVISEEDPQHLSWIKNFKIQEQSYGVAEQQAERFRELYFDSDYVSPIFSLPTILAECLNIFLFVTPLPEIEGACAILDGRAFIFVSPRSFKPRMLFTVAHELGHLIAGHVRDDELAYVDQPNQIGKLVRPQQEAEAFADAFASALLMPPAGIGTALEKLRKLKVNKGPISDVELLYICRIFGVSFESAARRCEDLKILPRGGARSLYDYLKKNYKSPEKRAESLNLPPRPAIEMPSAPPALIRDAIKKVRDGDLSVGKASALLRMTISDFSLHNAELLH